MVSVKIPRGKMCGVSLVNNIFSPIYYQSTAANTAKVNFYEIPDATIMPDMESSSSVWDNRNYQMMHEGSQALNMGKGVVLFAANTQWNASEPS
jgi:hypothetical protein